MIKTFDFEAAHAHPLPGGAAPLVHGHRFHIHVSQSGQIDPAMGWLVDFGEIKAAVKPVLEQLDHRYLNGIEGLESGEPGGIGEWVRKAIAGSLPFPVDVHVTCRESQEFESSSLPEDPLLGLPERLSFRFEAAHSLPKTPEGHKCRRLHGHSYEVQTACETAAGPGVELLGQSLKKIHDLLNNSHLNHLPGLENPTAELLCHWLWQQLHVGGLTPRVVSVGETCESRCIYSGE